jgi:Xaa-Pro aminopeptidase
VHEPPYIGVKSEGELRAGMVVTIEPTFYDETALNYITKGIGEHGAEGVFYVEDNVVVTTNGSENLTPLSKDLWIVK